MVIKTMTLLLYLGGGIIEHTGPMSMSECLKMKRTIERHIENPLATDILAGKFQEGQTVIVDWISKNKAYVFKVEDIKSQTKAKVNN